jgi:7,8-dihydro-6-hydroxymethylpterin-pyrophosphokinase
MPTSLSDQDGLRVTSGKQVAYIALGSNLGDRISMIEKACREMDSRGIRITRTSSLWETEPMYVLDQERFINGVCEVGCCVSLSFSLSLSLCMRVCVYVCEPDAGSCG